MTHPRHGSRPGAHHLLVVKKRRDPTRETASVRLHPRDTADMWLSGKLSCPQDLPSIPTGPSADIRR